MGFNTSLFAELIGKIVSILRGFKCPVQMSRFLPEGNREPFKVLDVEGW